MFEGLKRHIAAILAGIFLFPIFFQPMHVVWHHSHEHAFVGYIVFHTKTVDYQASGSDRQVAKKETICPVCTFQFAINDLPLTEIYHALVPFSLAVLKKLVFKVYLQQLISYNSSRAPPVFNFSCFICK